MDAIVNFVLATSVSSMVVYSWLPPEHDEREYTSIRDTVAVKAICTETKCLGDFPVSSTRRYAEAEEDGHYRELQGMEGQIFLAESKYQGVEVCPVWDLSGGRKKGTLRFASCLPGGFNFQVQR
jgi:hypothetical protein